MRQWGSDAKYCRDLINPGFHDCFGTEKDFYLSRSTELGEGEAGLAASNEPKSVGKSMGNHDYSQSDHKWLMVAVDI